jgi:hypothetical protein
MSRRAVAGLLLAVAAGAGAAGAAGPERAAPPAAIQHPGLHPPAPEEPRTQPHRTGELDCRGCHQSKHQGVVRMYVGIGGRGTPTIPSHMFQVRVECIACHTTAKTDAGTASVIGQTFRPSEQACVSCHGEKYRGMLQQWGATLNRMTEAVTPKLEATQAMLETADRSNPKTTRAQTLVDDAGFNIRYVALAKGIHNVFYAADLLKLASGWLDEATALLGKPPVRTDDQLVRGGYCAILCHEAARVKQREIVTFAKLRVPHVRHVTEFGATCTSCHSAETHKGVTATAATCSSCHHHPQNERCEGCHRQQAAFYRGATKTPLVKMAPNLMAAAVSCTGCHDGSRKHSRAAVGEKCVGCHEAPYAALLTEWTTGFDGDLKKTADAIKNTEAALARARRGGRATPEADALVKDARDALALVRSARGAHNPLAADALLRAAREKAEKALAGK